MIFIILAWVLTGKDFKTSQAFALIANAIYTLYGISFAIEPEALGAIPIILLGVILTGINAYNLRKAMKKPKRKETWTPELNPFGE
jgi:hypothetical protein